MTDAQRNALRSLIRADNVKSEATTEATTSGNVGGFAVPLGGMLRRFTPAAPAVIEPAYPNFRWKRRKR
jgi:hypothetical protein